MTRRSFLFGLAGGVVAIGTARAQRTPPPATTPSGPFVIKNVRIFNGIDGKLRPGNILVSDRKIKHISPVSIAPPAGGTVIDGQGHVLMPGLTDAHWHMTMAANTVQHPGASRRRPDVATSGNCQIFAMSGERNPYKEAKLGVLQEGAWADMVLVNGDPTKDIDLLRDYRRNLLVIIKNGNVYKNMLA